MNTSGLARQYHLLTPLERFALAARAEARGDDQEEARLLRSAPRKEWRVADCYGHAEALRSMSLYHAAEQLSLAGQFWRFYWMCEAQAIEQVLMDEHCAPTPSLVQRLERLAKFMAFRLVAAADGWELFLQGLGINAYAPLAYAPWREELAETLESARPFALTTEEADVVMKDHIAGASVVDEAGRETELQVRAVTAADVAAKLRRAFDELAGQWA